MNDSPFGTCLALHLTPRVCAPSMTQGATGLTTELVVRLCNEFPTTEREVREFEARTRMQAEKLDEVVDGMLGSSLGRTLTDAEKEQMKTMVRWLP